MFNGGMSEPRDEDEYRPIADLAELFAGMVQEVTDGGAVRLDPERIVTLAHHCIPFTRHTGVVLREAGVSQTVAATSDAVGQLDAIRDATGEGPALDVLEVNDMVMSEDLAGDPRWPTFGQRAFDELGTRSVLCYRLYLGPQHRAALIFLSDWPFAFDDSAMAIGSIFASYASLSLLIGHLLHGDVSLQRSQQVHIEIGAAVGILLCSQDITVHQAYKRLHDAARHLGSSLPEVAARVLRDRRLPDEK